MTYSEIANGLGVSLQDGHLPQFIFGADENKPSNPGAGDTYYATDSRSLYVCYVSGTWALVSDFATENYSNHLGATDNFTETVVSGNGTATANNTGTYHKMDLVSGAGVAGHAQFSTKNLFSLTTKPMIVNMIPKTIQAGNGNQRHTFIGLKNDFSNSVSLSVAALHQLNDDTWETVTGDGVASTVTAIAAPGDGDLITIIATTSIVLFFNNGTLLATHTTNIPSSGLYVGGSVIATAATVGLERKISIDSIFWARYMW